MAPNGTICSFFRSCSIAYATNPGCVNAVCRSLGASHNFWNVFVQHPPWMPDHWKIQSLRPSRCHGWNGIRDEFCWSLAVKNILISRSWCNVILEYHYNGYVGVEDIRNVRGYWSDSACIRGFPETQAHPRKTESSSLSRDLGHFESLSSLPRKNLKRVSHWPALGSHHFSHTSQQNISVTEYCLSQRQRWYPPGN